MLYFLTDKANRCWLYDQVISGVKTTLPGFCAGMVISWVSLRSKGQDFETHDDGVDVSARLTEEEIGHILTTQNKLESLSGRKGYDSLFHPHKLQVPKVGTHKITATHNTFDNVQLRGIAGHISRYARDHSSFVESVPHTWFLMRLRPPTGSGHVVGIEVSGTFPNQGFRLMDPNNGCFIFADKKSFKTWLMDMFFTKTGYRELYTGFVKLHPIVPRSIGDEIGESLSSFFSGVSQWFK